MEGTPPRQLSGHSGKRIGGGASIRENTVYILSYTASKLPLN